MEYVMKKLEYANVLLIGKPRTGMVMPASGVIVDIERLDQRHRVQANQRVLVMEFALVRQLIGKK